MTLYFGAGVALITPFKENSREIDFDAYKKLLDFHLEQKTAAVVVAGTTGESATLTQDEVVELVKLAKEKLAGKIPVIANTASNDTYASVELTKKCEQAGADAILAVTPYYNKTSYNGMLAHFEAIADSTKLPIILYHVPGRTGVELSLEQVKKLSEKPNIIGIKDATGDMEYTKSILDNIPGFLVYSGNDDLTYDIVKMGGHGSISVTANVIPYQVQKMCELIKEGKLEEAQELNETWDKFNQDVFCEVNPIPIKYLAHVLGFCANSYRLPLVEPADDSKKLLESYTEAIKEFNEGSVK